MLVLSDHIQQFESYKKRFSTWEASQILIDEKKAFWQLNKPDSNSEKVCLFRDGSTMCIYGDYGSYVFDKMTWEGNPWNLQYNNLDYQAEKISRESRDSVIIFDPETLKKNFLKWVREYLHEHHAEDIFVNKILDFLKEDYGFHFCGDTDDLFEEIEYSENSSDYGNYDEFFCFVSLCKRAMNEMDDTQADWTHFLRSEHHNFDDLGIDAFESGLHTMSYAYNQRYLISLYAIQVISEKLPNPFKK